MQIIIASLVLGSAYLFAHGSDAGGFYLLIGIILIGYEFFDF